VLIATFIACFLAMFAAVRHRPARVPRQEGHPVDRAGVAIFPVISIVTPLFNLWRQIGLYDTWPG
jgi:multiple sugar transport system permease protein